MVRRLFNFIERRRDKDLADIWASLPGAGYGQNKHSLDYLRGVYVAAGGVLA
ncbi:MULTISPECIES: hypothetical protein [unclassified Cupriavidus]|uniref:hypothetical protein n=1 Tax=unclassified Cupriavidus TaxID=2640874 RepID=UPI00226F15CF|nr:hypothetical protein [Cupriavidus sp. D39]